MSMILCLGTNVEMLMSDEYNDENSLFILDNCREEGLTDSTTCFYNTVCL